MTTKTLPAYVPFVWNDDTGTDLARREPDGRLTVDLDTAARLVTSTIISLADYITAEDLAGTAADMLDPDRRDDFGRYDWSSVILPEMIEAAADAEAIA